MVYNLIILKCEVFQQLGQVTVSVYLSATAGSDCCLMHV